MIPVNIPAPLLLPTMLPLDAKCYFNTKVELMNLGDSSYKAYQYYDCMVVMCREDRSLYIWMERPEDYTESGLMPFDFIYPAGVIVDDIVYAGKRYNFFNYYKFWFTENPVIDFNLGFRYSAVLSKLMDNNEEQLDGDYQPNVFVASAALPYKVKTLFNIHYTEKVETVDVNITLFDENSVVKLNSNTQIVLPPYPGQFESIPIELPAIIPNKLYALQMQVNLSGTTDFKIDIQKFRIV